MPYVRLTILRPIPDRRERARELLEEIDHLFAEDPEMIMSFEFGEEGRNDVPLGRVALANECSRQQGNPIRAIPDPTRRAAGDMQRGNR